mmetsp:Transcript_20678/g.38490  ORF Transcript_20678/g.38490 Transcript_20678/m.38490 type:complete len:1040 (+) Transcript_20678:265-3384(+)
MNNEKSLSSNDTGTPSQYVNTRNESSASNRALRERAAPKAQYAERDIFKENASKLSEISSGTEEESWDSDEDLESDFDSDQGSEVDSKIDSEGDIEMLREIERELDQERRERIRQMNEMTANLQESATNLTHPDCWHRAGTTISEREHRDSTSAEAYEGLKEEQTKILAEFSRLSCNLGFRCGSGRWPSAQVPATSKPKVEIHNSSTVLTTQHEQELGCFSNDSWSENLASDLVEGWWDILCLVPSLFLKSLRKGPPLYVILYYEILDSSTFDRPDLGENVERKRYSKGASVGLVPSCRVLIMISLSFFFSLFLLVATMDEYAFGPTASGGFLGGKEGRQYDKSGRAFPVEISFEELGCRVNGQDYPILANVTGVLPPGQITGILGPSGAGKTVFVQNLLGRGNEFCSQVLGTVFVNQKPKSLGAILDRVGYVHQQDEIFEGLTVEEALRFSASWRLPHYLTAKEHEQVLEETLEFLDLGKIRHEYIGGATSGGLSGGQRKLVSIGIELIMNPSVLIMDEPTSGLDAKATLEILKRLRAIADKKGVSVVIVMHVPSARAFGLLDNVILMQQGEAAYVGPISNVLSTMAELGFPWNSACASASSEATGKVTTRTSTVPEFLLDVVAGETTYPDDLCPYHDMVKSKYSGQPLCNGKPTLTERWRQLRLKRELREHKRSQSHSRGLRSNALHEFKVIDSTAVGGDYPRVLQPGLIRQMYGWFIIVSKIAMRKGMIEECGACVFIAGLGAWVRSYSSSWNARALSNLLMSFNLSCFGALSAVFNDLPGPVRRASQAGMKLGSHHNAVLIHGFCRSLIIGVLYASSYHTLLLLRKGTKVGNISFGKFLRMIFLTSLVYWQNWQVGKLLCVLGGDNFQARTIMVIGYLLWSHVFAMFSPNSRQIALDSFIVEKYDLQHVFRISCAASPGRYSVEAFALWDIPPQIGAERNPSRQFMLRYFGYRDEHHTNCMTILMQIIVLISMIRWAIIVATRYTEFHITYEFPLLGICLFKLYVSNCFLDALWIATRNTRNELRRRRIAKVKQH